MILKINVHINGEPINRVSITKYVGMYIDENLKWDVHIDKIIPKILAKISIVRSLRKLVPIDTLTLMYNTIVLDSASATSKCKLQSLQTRAARLITDSGPRTNRNPMYKSLSWLSLQHRRDFDKCVMVYKCRNSLAPSYLEILFTSNDTKHTYNTRHSSQLRSTKTRTYYHKSYTVSGHKLWNDLPSTIQNCTTLPTFKKALYKFYLDKTQFQKDFIYFIYF